MAAWDWVNGIAFAAFVMWRMGMIHPAEMVIDTFMNPSPQQPAQEQEVISGDSSNSGRPAQIGSEGSAANPGDAEPVIQIRRD